MKQKNGTNRQTEKCRFKMRRRDEQTKGKIKHRQTKEYELTKAKNRNKGKEKTCGM